MTDNLKRAGIFRKSVYIFLRCLFLTFAFRILGVFVDKLYKTNHARNKKTPARYTPANCAKISKVTSGGGNWNLVGLGTSRSERVRSEIQLLYSFMKYDYEEVIASLLREFYKLSIDI